MLTENVANSNRPLSVDDAAAYCNLKKSYIYKLIHEKRIPHYKPTGGKVFFKLTDLQEFVFRGRISASYEMNDMALSNLQGKR